MQHNHTTGTVSAPGRTLYAVGCDLQDERNLGVETSCLRDRSVEEIEGEEHGNGWAIGMVCGIVLVIIGALMVASVVLIGHWLFG